MNSIVSDFHGGELSMRAFIRMMLFCLLCALLSFNCFAQSGMIAADQGAGLPVNGALATNQSIDRPNSVAPDGVGGFYFSSPNQNRIYHVAAGGQIRSVAGNGAPGYSGDGGQAASAQLKSPGDVAIDSAGNLYICDDWNNRIRKVTPDGAITTVAGNGKSTGIEGGTGGVGALPMTLFAGLKPPVLIAQALPPYTQEARDAKAEGVVIIRCLIRTDGRVDSCKILKGLGYGLDESAIDTVQTKWRFKPATSNGAPVDMMTDIEVRFKMF
jgi:TonB family protein